MGDKKKTKKKHKHKAKDKCCEKFIRKGKHCKGCPMADNCELPDDK